MRAQSYNVYGPAVFVVCRMGNKLVTGTYKQVQLCNMAAVKKFNDIFYPVSKIAVADNKTIPFVF